MPSASPIRSADVFVNLTPRRTRRTSRPRFLLYLGLPVMGFGLWLATVAALQVIEGVNTRALVSVGAGLVLVGLMTLVVRLRQGRRAALPVPELALAGGLRLRPGASVALRIRQPGPVRLDRLKAVLVCERRYSRQVMEPGSAAVSSVEEKEIVSASDLLDEHDVCATRRAPWEKAVTLTVPPLAKPTGPVLPSGSVWWHIDVSTETGRGTPLLDQFNVVVVLPSESSAAPRPAPQATDPEPMDASALLTALSGGLGCGLITLAFLLVGPVFLYLYFSGAATDRGNPVMGLVAGILFSGLGLLAAVSLLKPLFRRSGRR